MTCKQKIIKMLEITDRKEMQKLYAEAYEVKLKEVGNKVFFRGIVEMSNLCAKDCYYCGIRKSNRNTERFTMDRQEIIDAAVWSYENEYGSIVLQSGELQSDKFTGFIEDLLYEIKEKTDNKLGITLSLGEQTKETYDKWYKAGGHRYLLRIETTNKELYAKLHPKDHSFEDRKACLNILRDSGYQVGTGVMIGLPFQTMEHLADDIIFFKENDIDMIGMGPYIPHSETPLAKHSDEFTTEKKNYQVNLGLKMIAAARLHLQDVNIAATTALQALHPTGREMGLRAGANIVMPNITETKYRASYQLYENKPCLDENSTQCRGCLSKRIDSIGEEIGFNEWGDSPHFLSKK